MDAAVIVGLLAEPERLRVLAALVLGARTPADVAAATGLDARAVGRALQKLQAAGLVDESGVRVELFKEAARAAAPAPEGTGDVIARFVRDRRLLSLPAQESKRRLVLEHVAQTFEPGSRYPEREVDAVLRAWTEGGAEIHPSGGGRGVSVGGPLGCISDHAALRRYLVDHQLLAREGGEYWRSGGWVDVLADPAVRVRGSRGSAAADGP